MDSRYGRKVVKKEGGGDMQSGSGEGRINTSPHAVALFEKRKAPPTNTPPVPRCVSPGDFNTDIASHCNAEA